MNILIMSDNFLPGIGGMENAVLGLANALKQQNHNVLVLTPHYNKKNENDSIYEFKIYRLPSIKIDDNNYYALPIYTKKLDDIIKDFKPDIVHCHSQASTLSLALKIKKKYNIPCICTMHTKYSACYKNVVKLDCIVKILCKRIGRKLNKVDKVIAVSKTLKGEFDKYGYFGGFDVIKNGANLKQIDNIDSIKNLAVDCFKMSPDENNLLFVGHISKVKNIDFILDSLEILNKTFDNFKMYFVGSGENEKYFKSRVENSEIKDKVVFTGKITDKNLLSSVYHNSKLFIFPSIFDNDSLAIIEAATFETPTITIEDTGSSERITNNVNGYTIKNDANDMAEKIKYLLNNLDEVKQVGINAKTQLPKTWIDASSEYIAQYEKLLQSKKIVK